MVNGIDVKQEERGGTEWTREAMALMDGSDPTSQYARQASDMRAALKEEAADLRVRQYALQVRQFLLRLDPRRVKAFVRELTGDPQGDWQQLFAHLAAIPDPPAKRLNPSYEKSKAFARAIRATRNTEQAILAARKAYDRAKSWNEFLDKKEKETAPALPAPTPKVLSLKAESSKGEKAA